MTKARREAMRERPSRSPLPPVGAFAPLEEHEVRRVSLLATVEARRTVVRRISR